MTIFSSLMQQIRERNAPQAQLVNDANSYADMLGAIPPSDPMHAFNAQFGMGVAGAPPEMSTLQAIGQAFPNAMNSMRQTEESNQQRLQQSLQMRQLASETIQAVDKYNFEKEATLQKLRHQDDVLGETKRHNMSAERIAMMGAHAKMMNAGQKGNLLNEVSQDRLKSTLKGGNNFNENLATLKQLAHEVKEQGVIIPGFGNPSMVAQVNSRLPTHLRIKLANTEGGNLEQVKESGTRLIMERDHANFAAKGLKEGFDEATIEQKWQQVVNNPQYRSKMEEYLNKEFGGGSSTPSPAPGRLSGFNKKTGSQ